MRLKKDNPDLNASDLKQSEGAQAEEPKEVERRPEPLRLRGEKATVLSSDRDEGQRIEVKGILKDAYPPDAWQVVLKRCLFKGIKGLLTFLILFSVPLVIVIGALHFVYEKSIEDFWIYLPLLILSLPVPAYFFYLRKEFSAKAGFSLIIALVVLGLLFFGQIQVLRQIAAEPLKLPWMGEQAEEILILEMANKLRRPEFRDLISQHTEIDGVRKILANLSDPDRLVFYRKYLSVEERKRLNYNTMSRYTQRVIEAAAQDNREKIDVYNEFLEERPLVLSVTGIVAHAYDFLYDASARLTPLSGYSNNKNE